MMTIIMRMTMIIIRAKWAGCLENILRGRRMGSFCYLLSQANIFVSPVSTDVEVGERMEKLRACVC